MPSPAPVLIPLDLFSDPADLTQALVDIPSVSGAEGPIADAIEAALRGLRRFEVVEPSLHAIFIAKVGADAATVRAGVAA